MSDNVTSQLSYLVAKAAWHLEGQVKAVVGAANLSVGQWRILVLLDERGGRPMSDLAQGAFVEAGTLTKMVDRLVSDAMVYRAPDARDRRRVLISLSSKGRRWVEQLRPVLEAQEASLAQRLGSATVAALQDASRRLDRPADRPREAGRQPKPIIAAAAE